MLIKTKHRDKSEVYSRHMDFCCGRGGTDRLTEREGRVSAKPIGGERGWVEEFKRSFKPYSRKRKKI